MNMKDISPEVLKWLFEQQEKDEFFAIYLNPDGVALSNGFEGFYLLDAYLRGALLSYLGNHGYTEKPWMEIANNIEARSAADYDEADDDAPLDP